MKHCPRCDFTFPDFHHVCDFDGAELITDPERPPLLAPRPSLLRRCLKSPLFLTALTAVGLLSSALLIGYFDSASQSAAVSNDQAALAANGRQVSAARVANQSTAVSKPATTKGNTTEKRLARTSFAHLKRQTPASRSVARVHRRSPALRSEIAQLREPQPIPQSQPISSAQATSRPQPVSPPQPASRPQATSRPQPVPTARPMPHDKDSKLTAMLKSTWRVLKKPFKL